MSWGEVEKLRAEEALGSLNSRGEPPGTLPVGGAVDDQVGHHARARAHFAPSQPDDGPTSAVSGAAPRRRVSL